MEAPLFLLLLYLCCSGLEAFLTHTPSPEAALSLSPQGGHKEKEVGRHRAALRPYPPCSPLHAYTQGPRPNTPSTWILSSCRSLSDMWENLQLEPKSHWPATEDREDRVTHCLEELPPYAEGHPDEGMSL